MKRQIVLTYEFVEYIPKELVAGRIYVSIPFSTASHKCCCGCGNEVVTPLSPTDWRLIFDGESISLDPSIGNWDFPCQSHYWIRRNRVIWARRLSQKEIEAGRADDRLAKERHFDPPRSDDGEANPEEEEREAKGPWHKLKEWWA